MKEKKGKNHEWRRGNRMGGIRFLMGEKMNEFCTHSHSVTPDA
jgi:hypothetical protein